MKRIELFALHKSKVKKCPKCGWAWDKMNGCNVGRCGRCKTSFFVFDGTAIKPIPTIQSSMKRIELFALHNQLRSSLSIKKFKNLLFRSDKRELFPNKSFLKECLDSIVFLKFALLCDKALKNKKMINFLKSGIGSFENLENLVFQKKNNFYCDNAIQLNLCNLRIAVKN